jgi:hypothetical protein
MMGQVTLHTRSFHPDEAFGLGGLGFKGDNRGFSSGLNATARIKHRVLLDLTSAQKGAVSCLSDESSNWALGKVGIKMSNDYSQERKKPRHNETVTITPYRKDGDQNVDARIKYAGKNFAFFLADTNAGHRFFGGTVSNEKDKSDTESGSLIPWGDKFSGFVPDLDVTNHVVMRISRPSNKVHITCNVSGDGFPNCETFLIDGAGGVLFLASHIRYGTAMTQLPGGRAIAMNYTLMEADWNADDTFGSQVNVQFAHDYAGSGGPFELSRGAMSRGRWNAVHTGRDASGNAARQILDNIPLPTLISPAY